MKLPVLIDVGYKHPFNGQPDGGIFIPGAGGMPNVREVSEEELAIVRRRQTPRVKALREIRAALADRRLGGPDLISGTLPGTVEDHSPWQRLQWEYAALVWDAVKDAQLVLWWPGKDMQALKESMQPAIYCPNLDTLAAVSLWLDDTRTCRKCGERFIPHHAGQIYCTPAHGNAYRKARSLRKQKR